MGKQDVSALLDALRPALEAAAKNVLRHAFGAEGMPWGTRLDDLEEMAVQVGEQLSRDVVRQALARQAEGPLPEPSQLCPCCGALGEPRKAPKRPPLQTRVGEVAWDEPSSYCPRCRRAFFPSEQGLGH